MDEAMMQAYSRLTMHEFVLEIVLANMVASMSERDGEQFLADFESRMRRAYTQDQSAAGDPRTDILLRDAIEMAGNLASKVRERAGGIRQALGS